MDSPKQKFALKISPEILRMVEKNYKEDGCGCRSAFIEKAIFGKQENTHGTHDYLLNYTAIRVIFTGSITLEAAIWDSFQKGKHQKVIEFLTKTNCAFIAVVSRDTDRKN